MRKFIRDIGKGFYGLFIGTLIVALIGGAVAFATNYTVTQGSGTTFGSIVVSAVNYAQQLLCDPSTPSQCAAVDASGILTVKGTVTANAGTNLNTSALATSANQTTANTTLATIASNTAAAIPDCGATPCTNKIGTVYLQSQYPAGAVVYSASVTGTASATTATLSGASSVTTYLCGFSIRANATAAATANATVTGTITGTLNFTQWTAPNASGLGITEEIFTPCLPASGTNQSVAVVSAAPGSGGVVSVTAWGYKF